VFVHNSVSDNVFACCNSVYAIQCTSRLWSVTILLRRCQFCLSVAVCFVPALLVCCTAGADHPEASLRWKGLMW